MEEERERNINVRLPLTWPPLGTWPATQACALTGNRTGNPLVHSPCSIHWAIYARHCPQFLSPQVLERKRPSHWPAGSYYSPWFNYPRFSGKVRAEFHDTSASSYIELRGKIVEKICTWYLYFFHKYYIEFNLHSMEL